MFGHELEPVRVGRFQVLEAIGTGGMGMVVSAYDDELERKVAVKVLRRDIEGDARACVLREARAMARLRHPNVVQVFEVGEDHGELYIAMDFVDGQRLDQWQTQPGRTSSEIVAAYMQAGRGLSAAHEAGLIHRDFKPRNVMVESKDDGSFEVRVLDFGLAQRSEDATSLTTSEAVALLGEDPSALSRTTVGALAGTPAYMAPEQVLGRPIDTTTDQFALCVALWEALFKEHPFGGGTVRQLLARVVRTERPVAPRSSEVPRHVAIALERGLALDPADRWPSMNELLEALHGDRRRHRLAISVGVAGLGSLLVATVMLASGSRAPCQGSARALAAVWGPARRDEIGAALRQSGTGWGEAVARRTLEALDSYASDWIAMHTETCEATAVHGDQSDVTMHRRMICLHRAKARLDAATRVLGAADVDVLRSAHEVVAGLPPLSHCADLERLDAEVDPPAPEEREAVDQVRSLVAQARANLDAGRYETARTVADHARRKLSTLDYGPIRSEVALVWGEALERLGQLEASEHALREALREGLRYEQRAIAHAAALRLMHVVGIEQRRAEDGMRYHDPALALIDDDSEREASTLAAYANLLAAEGRFTEATATIRSAVVLAESTAGTNSFHHARLRAELGTHLSRAQLPELAEVELRTALEIHTRLQGEGHPELAKMRLSLANAVAAQGRGDEARAELTQAVRTLEDTLGPDHNDVASALVALGYTYASDGDHARGEEILSRALRIREARLGADHPDLARLLHVYNSTLIGQCKYEEALPHAQRAVRLSDKGFGPEHPLAGWTRGTLGQVLHALDRDREAEQAFRGALSISTQAPDPDLRAQAQLRSQLADVLVDLGEHDDAIALHRQAVSELETVLPADSPDLVFARSRLSAAESMPDQVRAP